MPETAGLLAFKGINCPCDGQSSSAVQVGVDSCEKDICLGMTQCSTPAAEIIFLSGSALIEQQQSLHAWVRTCFITGCSTPHIFFPKEREEREPIRPLFPRSSWSCLAVSAGCANEPVRANSSLLVTVSPLRAVPEPGVPPLSLHQVFKQSGS